jgi:predicted dehydrogenase
MDRRAFLEGLGAAAVAAPTAAGAEASSARPVSVGLIGCGGRGSHLGREVLAVKEAGHPVELAAVCDIYQPRLERASTKLKARAYGNAGALLREGGVDAVIVATPDRTHLPLAIEAVRAGKDVYCEKPLCHWTQFELLKEFVAEARKRQAVVQVGAQWVSDPMWTTAASLVAGGGIGKVVHAQTGYFRYGDGGERGMPVEDPNAEPGKGLDWLAFQGDGQERPFTVSRFFQWRLYLDYAGGPIMDLYPHPLTRLLKALNVDMPERVVATGGRFLFGGGREVPDTADLLIEYPGGPCVSVLGTQGNATGIDTVIRGSEGTMTFDKSFGMVVASRPGGKGANRTLNSQQFERNHLGDWIECVRTRQKPRCDIELGYRVQVALIMGMRSLMERKTALWDPATEQIRMG